MKGVKEYWENRKRESVNIFTYNRENQSFENMGEEPRESLISVEFDSSVIQVRVRLSLNNSIVIILILILT